MTTNTNHFKEKLLAEKDTLEAELSRIAVRDESNPSNWEATAPVQENSEADENIAADNIEDYEENVAITNSLEARLKDVSKALANIESDSFGICEVCGAEIEEDRLEANPAAPTCKTHLN